MKKTVATALSAAMILSAGTAMAASFPNFDFNGDVQLHYRWNNDDASTPKNSQGSKYTFRLNANSDLSKNVSLYTRLAIQKVTNAGGEDFTKDYYNGDKVVAFDRLGFVVKGNDVNYTIGRQDVVLGQGLIVDSTGYIGIDKDAIDGITATGKSGVTNLKFVAGQGWTASADKYKLYAIDGSYAATKNLTLGATFAKVDAPNANPDVNFWGVNAGYTMGKVGFLAEYAKSNATADNKGYAYGVTYGFDSKHSAFAIYNNVETNANINTTYDDGGKGMYYGYKYKMSKDYTFDLFYKSMKTIAADSKDYNSLRTTVTYKF